MSKKKGQDGLPKRRSGKAVGAAWPGGDGLHMLIPGEKPGRVGTPEQVAAMTKAELRASPLYAELVKRQGQAAAAAALLNWRVELR